MNAPEDVLYSSYLTKGFLLYGYFFKHSQNYTSDFHCCLRLSLFLPKKTHLSSLNLRASTSLPSLPNITQLFKPKPKKDFFSHIGAIKVQIRKNPGLLFSMEIPDILSLEGINTNFSLKQNIPYFLPAIEALEAIPANPVKRLFSKTPSFS